MRCVECNRRLNKPAGTKVVKGFDGVLRAAGPVGPKCAKTVRLLPTEEARKASPKRVRIFELHLKRGKPDTRQLDLFQEVAA